MINQVLERLEALQAHLAAIDPTREIDAADKVAAIAAALRDTVAGDRTGQARLAASEHGEPLRMAG